MLRASLLRRTAPSVEPIAIDAVAKRLAAAPFANSGWGIKPANPANPDAKQIITKQFIFKDFHAAWAFMNAAVPKINTMDHHPEWRNVYNRVVIELTTHDAGNKVSEKDMELAAHLEEIAKQFE